MRCFRRLDAMRQHGKIHQSAARLRQPRHRPVHWLAVVRAEHGEFHHLAVPLLAAENLARHQFVDGDEVAERLRHLLAFHLQEAVVHPHIGHRRRAMRAARLRDLVLVVREDKIEPAAVNIKDLAQVFLGHRRAFDVPARTSRSFDAGRRRPRRLASQRGLPQDKIVDVALVGLDLDSRASFHFAERAAGQLAVVRHRGHVEQHMVVGDIGMAAHNELLDDRLHFPDMRGRARLDRRRQDAERRDVGVELQRRSRSYLAYRNPLGGGLGVDLVVDIGDIARVGDVFGPVDVPQQPEQHVEHDDRPRIADVSTVIDRRAADIHPHIGRIDGLEPLLAARQRVVERQFSFRHDKASLAQRLAYSEIET